METTARRGPSELNKKRYNGALWVERLEIFG